ncbi:MAG: tetratricopeptide repeat protein [Caulobacteraceae bacterium]
MADPQSLLELREKAFGADLASLSEWLGGYSPADLAEPALREIQGVAKYRGGDVPGAVLLIAEAVCAPHHTAHLKSLLFLMRGQFSAGDADGALMTARRVIEADPGNQEALKLAGRICNQRQDWDRADRFWRQLCEVNPGDPEAALQVARIGGRRGQWETQAFYADIQLRGSPDHAEALRLAIDGRLRAGRLDGLDDLMASLHRLEPERARRFMAGMNRPEQAGALAATLTRLRALDPLDETLASFAEGRAKGWLRKALAHEVAQEEDLAAMLFGAARVADPSLFDAGAGLWRLSAPAVTAMREALKADDEPTALEAARRVVEIDPTMVEALFCLGRLTLAGDPATAAGHLSRAAALAPKNTWIQLNLGRALERADRLVEAARTYAQVAALIADPADAHRAEAERSILNARQSLVRRARDALRENRLDDAWNACAAAAGCGAPEADIEAMSAAIKRAMFIALRDRFKNDDADFIEAAEGYLRLDPGHAEVLLFLGRKLMPARRHARAMEVWAKLAAMAPGEAHYRLQIARCCAWLKLNAEGAEAAGEALRLDPDLAEAATLLRQFAPAEAEPAPAGGAGA